MRIVSRLEGVSEADVSRWLSGFPVAEDYRVTVKPLRYRHRPGLAALTLLEERTMEIQVPVPFHRFGEVIAVGAVRRPGSRLRFIPLTEGVTFSTPREVVRFLYLHEFMHVHLWDRTRRGTAAETTCDRFALRNFRRRRVTLDDVVAAVGRSLPTDARTVPVAAEDPSGA
jgi:hypothetical protein